MIAHCIASPSQVMAVDTIIPAGDITMAVTRLHSQTPLSLYQGISRATLSVAAIESVQQCDCEVCLPHQ
jgi:hypothetical protein